MLTQKEIRNYIDTCHGQAVEAGWWLDIKSGEAAERNKGEMYALIHSEVSEAIEGFELSSDDEHIPHMLSEEVEMADVLIRIFDYCGGFGLRVDQAEINRDMFQLIDVSNDLSGKYKASAQINKAISAAFEGLRKNLKDDKSVFTVEEVNLAKAIHLVFEYSERFYLDVKKAIRLKLEVNSVREDHKMSNRLKEGGKKF